MRILFIVRSFDSKNNNEVITFNFDEARKAFMKKKWDEIDVWFEDQETKGNFNKRFEILKKIERFGELGGITIKDGKRANSKQKLVCEKLADFPESEWFLNKYLKTEGSLNIL